MRAPTIGDARVICERTGARAAIVITLGEDGTASASYGQTKRECRQTGATLDRIIEAIEDGRIPVWKEPAP